MKCINSFSEQLVSIKVCIVEDIAELRESAAAYLQEAPGFSCIGAFESGEEALEKIPGLKPDVVLMDINLPGMTGIQCVEKLKEISPSLPIMMLTVYENSDQVFAALSAGACGYLIKSTPHEKLLEAIRDVHNGGSPMSSHIARKVVQSFRSPARKTPLVQTLSDREQQVLELLAKGWLYKQIASELSISMGTLHTYIRRIYEKLHVNCRTEAVVKFLETK